MGDRDTKPKENISGDRENLEATASVLEVLTAKAPNGFATHVQVRRVFMRLDKEYKLLDDKKFVGPLIRADYDWVCGEKS